MISTEQMTDEQRKSVALEYLRRLDRGEDLLDLFAEDARLWFPKWGTANGREEIGRHFRNVGSIVASIQHDYEYFNYVIQGDLVVVEGTSSGVTADGVGWRAGVTHAGRWCDVFEIRDFKIQRLFIYLDPDYAGADTARYPWFESRQAADSDLATAQEGAAR